MYTEIEKQTLRGLAANCPAFGEFSHQVLNYLTPIVGHLSMLREEGHTGIDVHVDPALEAADEIVKMFKEVKL